MIQIILLSTNNIILNHDIQIMMIISLKFIRLRSAESETRRDEGGNY